MNNKRSFVTEREQYGFATAVNILGIMIEGH